MNVEIALADRQVCAYKQEVHTRVVSYSMPLVAPTVPAGTSHTTLRHPRSCIPAFHAARHGRIDTSGEDLQLLNSAWSSALLLCRVTE